MVEGALAEAGEGELHRSKGSRGDAGWRTRRGRERARGSASASSVTVRSTTRASRRTAMRFWVGCRSCRCRGRSTPPSAHRGDRRVRTLPAARCATRARRTPSAPRGNSSGRRHRQSAIPASACAHPLAAVGEPGATTSAARWQAGDRDAADEAVDVRWRGVCARGRARERAPMRRAQAGAGGGRRRRGPDHDERARVEHPPASPARSAHRRRARGLVTGNRLAGERLSSTASAVPSPGIASAGTRSPSATLSTSPRVLSTGDGSALPSRAQPRGGWRVFERVEGPRFVSCDGDREHPTTKPSRVAPRARRRNAR